MITIKRGDVVQITDEKHHWYPALLIVEEVKPFGCLAYAHCPADGNNFSGAAFIRLNHDVYARIGDAKIVIKEETND